MAGGLTCRIVKATIKSDKGGKNTMKNATSFKGLIGKITERGEVAFISLFFSGLMAHGVSAADVAMNCDIGVNGPVAADRYSMLSGGKE
jgi:hypothetical protein